MDSKHTRSKTNMVLPSVLQDIDLCQAVSKDLQIGWKEVLGTPVNPTDYIHEPDMSSDKIE